MENKFYVYAHQRLDDDSIFYIGKGSGDKRAWSKKMRNQHWKNIVKKADYRVLILQDGMSETDAFILEKYLIVFYGRRDLGEGRLVNLTDGGEGFSNPSQETKDKMSKAKLNMSEATRKKMSEVRKGRTYPPHSEATRQKISEAGKGIPKSEATRQKMSEASKGKTKSEDHRQKMSEAGKGIPKSEATRQKMSESQKGRKWFNDGTNTFFIKPEDALPHYIKGRL